MTSPRVRDPWLRAAGIGAAAVAVMVAACETTGPVHPTTRPTPVPSWDEGRGGQTALPPFDLLRAAVRRHYPEVLSAGPEEQFKLRFFVDADGRVERHEMLMRAFRPTMPEGFGFYVSPHVPRGWQTGPPVRAVDVVTFQPGELGPAEVVVLWDRALTPEELESHWRPGGWMLSVPAEPPPGQTVTGSGRWQRFADATRYSEGDDGDAPAPSTEEVVELVMRHMPGFQRASADFVWFVADANGQVVRFGDSRDTRELSARPAAGYAYIQAYFGLRMIVNGESVPVIWAQLRP